MRGSELEIVAQIWLVFAEQKEKWKVTQVSTLTIPRKAPEVVVCCPRERVQEKAVVAVVAVELQAAMPLLLPMKRPKPMTKEVTAEA